MVNKPIIGVTMGDAAGIGPEITLKAIAEGNIQEMCIPLVIGDEKILRREIKNLGLPLIVEVVQPPLQLKEEKGVVHCIDLNLLPEELPYGEISAKAGYAAYSFVEKAVELAKEREISAITTAPLNKEAMQLGGQQFPGHTEILATLTGTKDYSMMLSTPDLKVIHLTTHIGLIEAVKQIDAERTYNVIKLSYETLVNAGVRNPRIAVCGINPHAGENGLFGYGEEEEKLIPGIERAKKEGIEVSGPYPADTLFFRAVRGDFDIVVACYHDQGHGPVKVLGLESGVNITVGLKGGMIRTSVDHGTAFDIAGKGIANSGSMIEAIKMAVELSPKQEVI
ncbi:4-hydroxythreonine-4-phosphate dehydrogenase PdxA [Evansella halocellulosilytica]|uniref:4-hydroxythreonine-4-phosphate dehydrogenase PdxA n=1 Tax=Evansella halocellulosilytica TaxID=2011013 RepID=UPI000BB80DE7|nr:4-hydroxythreonine-4-phosphate dehydrogenase PdxA [Evansella halocellulosilytica]